MATCPNCGAQILLEASQCSACSALFGERSAWHPIPQSSEVEQQLRQRYAASTPTIATHITSGGNEIARVEKAAAAEIRYPVEFTASAGEYFRIWIVNLALTVLTLGIYSAWAKVRKRRYLYAHTRIGDESFEYRARPVAILKGRLLAVALLAGLIASGNLASELSLENFYGKALFFAAGVIVGPWLLARSLRFNATNTAYRNIRLSFLGTYASCFKVVIRYVWLIFIGILYPYFKHQLVKYAAENHVYGTTRFEVADFKQPFIHAYAVAFGLGILGGIGAIILVAGTGSTARSEPPGLLLLAIYGGFLLLYAFVRARTTNAVWNAIRVGPLRFECTMRGRDYMSIYLSNVVAILLTLGFATPWAVVHTLRYRAEKFAVLASAPLDGFAQAESAQVGAAGQEIAELFDFDIAL